MLSSDSNRRNRSEEDASSRSSSYECRESAGYRDSPEVSLINTENITSTNIGSYKLSGKCSDNERPISVKVNGYLISNNPLCDKRYWEVFLDLSSLESDDKISLEISHGKDSNVICEEPKVSFSCPKNYIAVAPLIEETSRRYPYSREATFCVMKYEAKVLSGHATSQPEGRPVVNISHQEAQELCRVNGSRYDLISNTQWQVLAHNIESQGENWSTGTRGPMSGNILNCGISAGIARAADNECDPHHKCGSGWHYKKRTHILPNNQLIWDVCGNAGEMMRDKNPLNRKSYAGARLNDYIYKITNEDLKEDFGPWQFYGSQEANGLKHFKYSGLGHINIDSKGEVIVRGAQHTSAGIYSTILKGPFRQGRAVGFRCVYNP